MLPIYHAEKLKAKARQIFSDDSHSGLWFECFYDYQIFDHQGRLIADDRARKDAKIQEKDDFFKGFAGSRGIRQCGDAHALGEYALRGQRLCLAQGGKTRIYQNDWLMAIGLGNSHPLENGLLWHPTLGVPYFQGSTVKGLAKALMEKWGADPMLIKRWFGSVNATTSKTADFEDIFGAPLTSELKSELDEQSTGVFIFLDALPVKPVMLKQSMMTPHYGEWYQKGDSSPTDKSVQPGDWHSPVPVSFLAVEKAVMQFGVMPRMGAGVTDDEIKQINNVIALALEHLGIGAKTATGYGRMRQDEQANLAQEQALKQEIEAREIEAQINDLSDNQQLVYLFKTELDKLPDTAWCNKANAQPKLTVKGMEYDFLDLFKVIESWSDDEQKYALETVFLPLLPKLLGTSISSNKKWKERINPLKIKLGIN